MNIKNCLVLILLIMESFSCKSQNLNDFEIMSREKATIVVNSYFEGKTKKPYTLLSIANTNYIILFEDNINYVEVIALLDKNNKVNILSETKISKPNVLFDKALNTKTYHKDFIGFKSNYFKDGYELSSGGTVYFVMSDLKNRYGESSLSVIIKPNPIDKDIYNYMLSRLINFER